MFYSTQILAKKGPLGLVWIAAHLDGRLKRQQISGASIGESVDTLLHPEAPLALRLSGQLLLGVVRIYQRKVRPAAGRGRFGRAVQKGGEPEGVRGEAGGGCRDGTGCATEGARRTPLGRRRTSPLNLIF